MRRIAVINQKGGVGKTTTTANLGGALAQAGKRVLLADLDPQAHLTLHFGVELTDGQHSAYDLLTGSAPVADVSLAARENITLIPADIDLAAAEVELISVTGREVILREALQKVEDDFDVLLIDCPPSLGVLTVNALVAAREVVIPLQAQFFALQGLGKLLDTVTLVRQRINPDLVVAGLVLCMHESATRLAGEVVEDVIRFLQGTRGTDCAWSTARLFDARIRRNIKLAEASSFGKTIFEYAPRSNGFADYSALATEMFGIASVVDLAPAGVDGKAASMALGPTAARPMRQKSTAAEPATMPRPAPNGAEEPSGSFATCNRSRWISNHDAWRW